MEEEEEEEEEEGARDTTGSREHTADVDRVELARSLATRCGDYERITSSADVHRSDGRDDMPHGAMYVLHSHFGGEELSSWLRVELRVTSVLEPLMEWLRLAPETFTVSAIPDLPGVRPSALAKVLATLQHNGYLTRVKAQATKGAS